MYLSIYLSIYLCIYLSIYVSIYLSIYLSIRLSIYLSIYVSIYLSIYLSIYRSIYLSSLAIYLYLSVSPTIYRSNRLSLYLSIYVSIYLSIYLSVYLSIYLSMYLSINLFIYLSFGSIYVFCRSMYLYIFFNRRKFRSQTSDNMDRWKAEQGRGREKRKIRRKKSKKKEDADAWKGRKVAKHRVFPMIWGSGGSKSRPLKRRVRSQLARWEMKNCTPLWREAHLQVKMYKTPGARSTFGSWDVEKVHALVARSIFPSQKCKKLTGTGHFWTFGCAFAWQAQGIVHLGKSEQNVGVLWHFQKRWQAWDIWRGSSKMHFAWQAQYKRHVHQRC